MTMEQILQAIKQECGMSSLRNGETLVGLFQDFSRNQLLPQANALKVFVNCQGNTRILNLQNAAAQEQQVQLHRLVQEMTTQYNMREETAVEICRAFWQAALETAPPVCSFGQPVPVPPARQEETAKKPLRKAAELDNKSAADCIPEIEKKLLQESQKPVPFPDPPAPKPKPRLSREKKLARLVLTVLLALIALSFVTGSDPSKRTRADLAPYNLEDSIEDMLLAGTEEIYTYPDGTRMEFYYDDSGKEIYRAYVNTDSEIEYLFEARYDSGGRLVYHQIFNAEGNLLRSDSYDFHSSEDTAQRRVMLGDGRYFQGVSTFDENGYETFTVIHQDGTQTVYVYKDGGMLTHQYQIDAAGETISDSHTVWIDWENQPKVYGPQQTVIGWAGSNGYVRPYVQGICGGALKEYSVEDDYAVIETYDPMGNLLEQLHYQDGQMQKLTFHMMHHYDAQGNYTGYTETFYRGVGELPPEEDYYITNYDAKGIKISSENHYGEDVSYERYETELDDQSREIRVQTFDGETGRLISIDETEYDWEGNVEKETRTYYHDDGMYSITVQNGDRKNLSDTTYYPDGSISNITEYTAEGVEKKSTHYYESGQIECLIEYTAEGVEKKSTDYYENGQIESVTEYNDEGKMIQYITYYESGNIKSEANWNDRGEAAKHVYYKEDGTILSE